MDLEFLYSICVLSIFLLFGKLLRANIKLLQILFLPSAIIAGFLALFMGPYGLNLIPAWIINHWSPLPGILINIVFASLFLGVDIPKVKKIWNYGGSQLCFGVVAGMGQYFIALLVTVLLLAPVFKVHLLFGCIVEIGFSGGHGTAAGMKDAFKGYGFAEGGDLALMSATVGILTAVLAGMILINIAIRKNYCAYLSEKKGIPAYKKKGLIPKPERFSIATATVASEAIEPLTFHFSIIAIAVSIGWAMLSGLQFIHREFDKFPLFPLAMIGGLIIQKISIVTKIDKYFDKNTFDRILGFALDILVISAIATIKLDVFLANAWPFTIIMATGISWMVFCAVFIAPRMFKKYWFERGITEFGMQTGVTAIGLMLLRVVDPLYKTDTAKAFGFKQMIYEPFLGGGFITAFAPMLISNLGVWLSMGISFAFMAFFFLVSYLNGWVNFRPELEFKD
ncbi:MAG: sodium:glutamate symporter [Candidatus Aminicenantes bacterium]|nr:sodium:glutamate symporter [Candidatus Aminicenantes bacterium]